MIVFKTFFRILKKQKIIILIQISILLLLTFLNLGTASETEMFGVIKSTIGIINDDKDSIITKNLIEYINRNSKVMAYSNKLEKVDDALFYREINLFIHIPKGYGDNLLKNKESLIEIKSSKDKYGRYAEMLLLRYLKVQNTYQDYYQGEDLINKINEVLMVKIKPKINSNLDLSNISRTVFYFNFLSYTLLFSITTIICLLMISFKDNNVEKKNKISPLNYKKINFFFLISHFIYAFLLWLILVIISIFLLKEVIFSKVGLIYIVNSFLFSLSAITMALVLANLVNNRKIINGVVNLFVLAPSFLGGAFVPTELLAPSILKIGKLFPTYWYIQTNEYTKTLDIINLTTLQPIINNMIIIFLFGFLFVIINNVISKIKLKNY